MQLLKHTYYDDGDMFLRYEPYRDVLFLHVECDKWSTSVYKKMLSIFEQFKHDMKEIGVPALLTITPNPKFCKMFGGEVIENLKEGYTVLVWDLK